MYSASNYTSHVSYLPSHNFALFPTDVHLYHWKNNPLLPSPNATNTSKDTADIPFYKDRDRSQTKYLSVCTYSCNHAEVFSVEF